MKPYLFPLPLLALWPLHASAQTPTTQPEKAVAPTQAGPVTIDPAAQAILARAVATYKGVSGLSYRRSYDIDGFGPEPEFYRYSRPYKLRVERRLAGKPTLTVIDGSNIYHLYDGEYRHLVFDEAKKSPLTAPDSGESGHRLAAMLAGRNPLGDIRERYSPLKYFKSRTVALGTRIIEGEPLQGIRCTTSFQMEGWKWASRFETTAWFGGSPLTLRRVQNRNFLPKGIITITERLTEQQLSPVFPKGTYVVNRGGLEAPVPRPKTKASPHPQAAKETQAHAMDAQARALLEQAVTTYKGAGSISYRVASSVDGAAEKMTLIRYAKPHGLRVEGVAQGKKYLRISDGIYNYTLLGDEVQTTKLGPFAADSPLSFATGTTGAIIAQLMEGRNWFNDRRDPRMGLPYLDYKRETASLGTRTLDGEVLQGVRDSLSYRDLTRQKARAHVETTAWFGGSPLTLRRVQTRTTQGGQTTSMSEKIVEQQLSPHFPTGTFDFDPTGLKPMEPKGIPAEKAPVAEQGTAPVTR